MEFHVPDMSCGHCTAAIEKSVVALDPQATVTTDLESRVVTIATSLPEAEIVQGIKSAGYDASPA